MSFQTTTKWLKRFRFVKKRSVNFSHEETALIREGVMKFDKVLTKKFSSGSTPVTKKIQDGAWAEITEKVNSVGRACRTIDDVKGMRTPTLIFFGHSLI